MKRPETGLVYATRRFTFSAAHRYWRRDWSPEENRNAFGSCVELPDFASVVASGKNPRYAAKALQTPPTTTDRNFLRAQSRATLLRANGNETNVKIFRKGVAT